jgi:hypothetical protein
MTINIRHYAEMAALVLHQKAADLKLRDRYATAADHNDAAEFFKRIADGDSVLLEISREQVLHEQVLHNFAKALLDSLGMTKTEPRIITVTIIHDRAFNTWRVIDDGGKFADATFYGGNLAANEADRRHDFYIAHDETVTVNIRTRNV